MKKKGFTMIETIAVLFIVLLLFSGAASMGRFERNIYKDIEYEGFLYEAQDLLTYVKLKSRLDNSNGSIIIDQLNNKIHYSNADSKILKSIAAPSGTKIFCTERNIPVVSGRFNKSCTITFQNCFNDSDSISIRVGVDYINFKSGK